MVMVSEIDVFEHLSLRNIEDHPLKLFSAAKCEKRPLYISGPMVRYSKLPFRSLVRIYGVDLAYTPMMVAKEFLFHSNARYCDFSTNLDDRPVVSQFASNDPIILGRAVEIISNYVDGISLNCGCPQSWVCQEGLGAHLMHDLQNVCEMVKAVKERCGRQMCVEVKIRIHGDLRKTVDWAQKVQAAGIDYIVVHGRRRNQRSSEPVNLNAIKLIKESLNIPVVANGDVFTFSDVNNIAKYTNADGIMSSRGILANPALFSGFDTCPWSAIERFIEYSLSYGLNFHLFKYHILKMMGKILNKKESCELSNQMSIAEILDWIDERFILRRPGDSEFGNIHTYQRKLVI
ncbi:hypothetical protein PNEG_03348 [Pneumocystis murina B123]|uniref:tRNA-dihydrouridine(20a/20b) synthase [NAD(P)+] n=1 Tax=Pneumocystis murina (strain B123) TaxID=1069680 RepID=M7P2S3_PNEMU|nr:hypothetical protein PNEG_03348 [Pneumocystis murina B123]EMR08175.1 hypothetical protein PNEG_03348 [Pneumocystis murina B123]